MAYEPTYNDVAWQLACFDKVREGGIWSCPMAAAVYVVYHSTKTIVGTMMPLDDFTKAVPADQLKQALEVRQRIKLVTETAGWKYEEK